MKILLAGPGTGKTTKIKKIIDEQFPYAKKIQVLSFTNATVNDLTENFAGNDKVSCATLHSFALRLNHLPELHILLTEEKEILHTLAKKTGIDFSQLCDLLKCMTFDGMISECVSFIKANPAYAKEKVGQLDLLVVDEFQDFNPTEQELVKLTSKLASDTIILGDDDQCIYGFKDADPNGIIALYNDQTVERITHENICYRCPTAIVEHCKKLLSKNKNRIAKDWKSTDKAGEIIFEQFVRNSNCDNYIIERVHWIRENDKDASILILSPVGFAVETLKQELATQEIEYIDCWPEAFDKETLTAIWWLNAIYTPTKLPFLLFLLKYYNHFAKTKVINLIKERFQKNFNEEELTKAIIELGYLPEPFSSYILNHPSPDEVFQKHNEFNIALEYIDPENLEKSISKLTTTLNPKKEFAKGKINLMSIHKSKGLQAEYVIINGLVTGILPNEMRGIDTIEAQRRLLFVGMTRALKQLYLISTVEWEGRDIFKVDKTQFEFKFWSRKYNGKTSKFIQEIK